MNTQDTWSLGGREFTSRFILGSGKYSLELIEAAVRDAGAQMITLAVRRANTTEKENILDYIPQGVTLLPERESPFSVRTVDTFHDDQGGALRGTNTIHILTAGGITVAHMGDLGHQLSQDQLAAIGPVDGVLVPVGGFYTVDAAQAKQVCESIRPKWVVPMHYHQDPYGLSNIGGVEPFIALWPAEEVHRLTGAEFSPDADTTGLLILKF